METRDYVLKICILQAIVVAMLTWQIFATKIYERHHDRKRLQFCQELTKELPKIDCSQLETN